MRQRLVWLVTLPLALVGSELGHAALNALVESPGGPRREFLESEGFGAELVPWLGCAVAAVVLLALLGRAVGAWTSHRSAAWPFFCLAPMVFVLQEHLETFLRNGGVPLGTISERTFLPGLAIQLPFALGGYLLARSLLRLSDRVCLLIARRRPARRAAPPLVASPRAADCRSRGVRGLTGCFGRAPPAGHLASA